MDTKDLTQLPIFSALGDNALLRLSTYATEETVPAGRLLVHQGDYAYGLAIIRSGTAEVRRDGRKVGTLSAGDVFGELGAIGEGERRSADVVATSRMELIALTRWDLRHVPELLERVQDVAAERRDTVPA